MDYTASNSHASAKLSKERRVPLLDSFVKQHIQAIEDVASLHISSVETTGHCLLKLGKGTWHIQSACSSVM